MKSKTTSFYIISQLHKQYVVLLTKSICFALQRKNQYIIDQFLFLFLNDTQKIENFREKKNKKKIKKNFYIILDRLVCVLNHDSLNHDIDDYLKKKNFLIVVLDYVKITKK